MKLTHIPTGHKGELLKANGDLIRVRLTAIGPDGEGSVGNVEEWARKDIREF